MTDDTTTTTLLRRAIALAASARDHGNHPFGALLVNAAGEIVAEAENTVTTESDATGHAETNLVRNASREFGDLAALTLYTSTEPCAMCSGAIYWSGIRSVVYALPEHALYEMTGDDSDNPTLALPCREVFARGRHAVTVSGPHLEHEAAVVHEGFWS